LSDCYAYVRDELNPSNTNEAIQHVNTQFLASDMRDSTVANTGLPMSFKNMGYGRVPGPVLVQIMSLTDIGQSAFTLKNVRQTRLEREDLAGLEEENGDDGDENEDEDAGPVPKYPRGMLKLELTDGSMIIPAIEFRKIPQLQLGETPLGCKVCAFCFILVVNFLT
jgi:RecQ-mediated genome instability protein 1